MQPVVGFGVGVGELIDLRLRSAHAPECGGAAELRVAGEQSLPSWASAEVGVVDALDVEGDVGARKAGGRGRPCSICSIAAPIICQPRVLRHAVGCGTSPASGSAGPVSEAACCSSNSGGSCDARRRLRSRLSMPRARELARVSAGRPLATSGQAALVAATSLLAATAPRRAARGSRRSGLRVPARCPAGRRAGSPRRSAPSGERGAAQQRQQRRGALRGAHGALAGRGRGLA